ncbi:MAG: MBL fold metallo-hydrolase [Anaerolineae bacterium]|nr:MBL fold metallo-hydrolase [Anaerolineae bacterium]
MLPTYLHPFSLPTPFPVGPVNVYLAEGEPLTLVDAGPHYDPARQALEEALAGLGYRVADLQRIVITHAHADHYGLAAELAEVSGAEVLAHAASIPWMSDEEGFRRLAFYGEVMIWAGVPQEMLTRLASLRAGTSRYTRPLVPKRTLVDGDLITLGGEAWTVLHTPGHAGGLICLHQPERRLLLSSDHLLRYISSNPILEPPGPGEKTWPRRLVEYMAQLNRVAALDLALTLPGHGPPLTDHRALIQERLAFHEQRAAHILDLLRAGPLTAHSLAQALFPTGDIVNYFLALSEVIGHLQWLEVSGRATCYEADGIAYWQAC